MEYYSANVCAFVALYELLAHCLDFSKTLNSPNWINDLLVEQQLEVFSKCRFRKAGENSNNTRNSLFHLEGWDNIFCDAGSFDDKLS